MGCYVSEVLVCWGCGLVGKAERGEDICSQWLGLWIARSGRLKGEYVMSEVAVTVEVTVMVKSWVVAGGVIST